MGFVVGHGDDVSIVVGMTWCAGYNVTYVVGHGMDGVTGDTSGVVSTTLVMSWA